MRKVNFSKILPIKASLALEQISKFEEYSSYIPGCTSSKLIERNQEYEIGELEFTHMFKTYKIKSKNYYVENTIRVKQIEGPFKVFEGMWTVLENETNSAQILFDANFELPFLLDNLVTDDMIDQFSNEALESFIKKTTNC